MSLNKGLLSIPMKASVVYIERNKAKKINELLAFEREFKENEKKDNE